MTDFVYQLSVSIPSGQQYEKGDMLNVRADNPDQFAAALDAIADGTLAQKAADAASALKAAYAAVSGIPGASVTQDQPAQQQAPQQSAWGQGQQSQQQRPAQQNNSGNRYGGTPHPEGKSCEMCGKVLEAKTTSGGKKVWRCPDWRWSNGNPNGHTNEFVN